ncbi:hypothetical protein [Streptomyces sp. NBC_01314]|uniref:hypothetical protein n=1 Tax=Streptomyces sp. NBC_01314 TaxID=2903821 RepID=UPI00308E82E1|nr:hypothetical protein OG622_50300 [Streptomyces sp. NBC_01314]
MKRWDPPDPHRIPEWRSGMIEHLSSNEGRMSMRAAVGAGRFTIVPTVPDMHGPSADSVSTALLTACEAHRLTRADLYYATPDMTALALAAAQTPPIEPVSLDRLPSRAGLIVFGEPIGGYTEDVTAALAGVVTERSGPPLDITTPIVAASWSVWSPREVDLTDGPGGPPTGAVRWLYKGQGKFGGIPDGWEGIWITFYSPRGMFSGFAPDTVLGTMHDGTVMTAGDVDRHASGRGPALGWDNEMLLREGAPFGPQVPDTTDTWAHVLYTAWQLMSQDGTQQWTEQEQLHRPRSGQKRDARQGITGSSAVRIVRVHPGRRPAPQAAREDADASTGRREPQWSCRWPVRPYRRSTCLNPRAHADGGCTHADRIVPGHIKGPEGAPLRTGSTVHLWDRQPDDATEAAK